MAELKERIAGQLKVLDQTLERIEKEANRYETAAKRQGLLHRGFTAALAVLQEKLEKVVCQRTAM